MLICYCSEQREGGFGMNVKNQDVVNAVTLIDQLREDGRITDDEYLILMPVVDSCYDPHESEI